MVHIYSFPFARQLERCRHCDSSTFPVTLYDWLIAKICASGMQLLNSKLSTLHLFYPQSRELEWVCFYLLGIDHILPTFLTLTISTPFKIMIVAFSQGFFLFSFYDFRWQNKNLTDLLQTHYFLFNILWILKVWKPWF